MVSTVSKIHPMKPTEDLDGMWSHAGSYKHVFVDKNQFISNENIESDSGILSSDVEFSEITPKEIWDGPENTRHSIAFVKLLFAAFPFFFDGILCVAEIFIKPDRSIEFYTTSVEKSGDLLDLKGLGSCLELKIYCPKYRNYFTVEVDELKLETIFEGFSHYLSRSLNCFFSTLKPTPEILDIFRSIIVSRISNIYADRIVLKETEELLSLSSIIKKRTREKQSPPLLNFPGISKVKRTESEIEEFAKKMKEQEIDSKQKGGEVFLKNYNTVRRIYGKQKFYMNVKYQKKQYQVRIRFEETTKKGNPE